MTLRVSVVVPTYQRPALLERCLEALANQDFDPAGFEVLIIDDANSPETHVQVAHWQSRLAGAAAPVLRYLPISGPHGPAIARNRGWQAARAPLVAFTDDDCVPTPTWLREGVAAFTAEVACVTGRIRMPIPHPPTDYELNESGLERAELVTANCICRREILARLGGFDERFRMAWREDSDLQFRLLRAGARIVSAPQAVVIHPVRPAPWGVSIAQQKKVQYDALLYKKHPQLFRARIRPAPPWRYYATVGALLTGAGAVVSGRRRLGWLAAGLWLFLTGQFCCRRLRQTSHRPAHVAEMAVTSAVIPPVSLFWRWVGQIRYRVPFF